MAALNSEKQRETYPTPFLTAAKPFFHPAQGLENRSAAW
jgi:hypothetical protein